MKWEAIERTVERTVGCEVGCEVARNQKKPKDTHLTNPLLGFTHALFLLTNSNAASYDMWWV